MRERASEAVLRLTQRMHGTVGSQKLYRRSRSTLSGPAMPPGPFAVRDDDGFDVDHGELDSLEHGRYSELLTPRARGAWGLRQRLDAHAAARRDVPSVPHASRGDDADEWRGDGVIGGK